MPGVAELNALLGLDVQQKQWENAMELVEGVEKRLKDLVAQANVASKGVKPPKVALTDQQEAMAIAEKRLKKGRIDALLATTDINKAISTIGMPGAPGVRGDPAKNVASSGDKILQTLRRVAIGFVGVQALRGFVRMGDESIEAASKIHDTAIATGISTDALQEFKFAAEQSGSSLEALIAGSKRLNLAVQNAATHGSGPAAKALKELGLNAAGVKKVIKEGGLDAGITLVSEKLQGIKDPAERSRIAMALLGKSGQTLLPTLLELSDLRQDARNLGGIIAADDIDAMENFGDQVGRVKFAVGGLKNQIVAALIPALKDITDGMLAWMATNRELIASTIKSVIAGIVDVLHGLFAVGSLVASVIGVIANHSDLAKAAIAGLAGMMLVMRIQSIAATIAAAAEAAGMGVLAFSAKAAGTAVRGAMLATGIGLAITLITLLIEHWDEFKEAAFQAGLAIEEALHKIAELPVLKQLIALMEWVHGGASTPSETQVATDAMFGVEGVEQWQLPSSPSVAPSANGGGAAVTIEGGITINSPNADPKQVADAIKPAVREALDDAMRKARK